MLDSRREDRGGKTRRKGGRTGGRSGHLLLGAPEEGRQSCVSLAVGPDEARAEPLPILCCTPLEVVAMQPVTTALSTGAAFRPDAPRQMAGFYSKQSRAEHILSDNVARF